MNRHENRYDGVLLLDKPEGMSSNQALQRVRRLLDARKGGHTGNLDPFATGMLPLCFGEATKTAGFMLDADKRYVATARLGIATDTGDREGKVVETRPLPQLGNEKIDAALRGFLGDTEQVPPMYSALKRDGKPLYELARAGRSVPRPPRRITIHALERLAWNPPKLRFRVHCSKGTYVRTLAEDIAKRLGTCAHLQSLRRERVGAFDPDLMVSLAEVEEQADGEAAKKLLLPVDAGLLHWPRLVLDGMSAKRFLHGNTLTGIDSAPGWHRVYGENDAILGLGEVDHGGHLSPRRVFVGI